MPDFRDIYGNKTVLANLRNAKKYDRVAHCYMFCGEDGLGKRTVAKAFAKSLVCEAGGEEPCGKCASCIQVENENHPDVIFVKHEKPTVFGVDDIRDGLNKSIVIRPYKSEKKIYILDDGEMLNAQAQNAMLKTIEEPPEYAVILILTNNREVFLPTILSRCVELNFQPVTDDEVAKYLTKNGFNIEEKRDEVLRFAAGNIGRAVSFLDDEEYGKMYKDVQDILMGLPRFSDIQIKHAAETLGGYKKELPLIIEQMHMWYHDVFLSKAGYDVKCSGDIARSIREQAELYGYDELPRILQEIETLQTRMKVNVNTELSFEVMLFAMRPEGFDRS